MQIIHNFITEEESSLISNFNFSHDNYIDNDHIREVNKATRGYSILCDMTQTDISREVSKSQGDNTLFEKTPPIFRDIGERIANTLQINKDHYFFQYIYLGDCGIVKPHYDAGMPGYITYKCNIFVNGPDLDSIYIDKNTYTIQKLDLYSFEANLYKHWMGSSVPRIHLSYGFLLPYADLGWTDCPRIRLSNRIWRTFIERN